MTRIINTIDKQLDGTVEDGELLFYPAKGKPVTVTDNTILKFNIKGLVFNNVTFIVNLSAKLLNSGVNLRGFVVENGVLHVFLSSKEKKTYNYKDLLLRLIVVEKMSIRKMNDSITSDYIIF